MGWLNVLMCDKRIPRAHTDDKVLRKGNETVMVLHHAAGDILFTLHMYAVSEKVKSTLRFLESVLQNFKTWSAPNKKEIQFFRSLNLFFSQDKCVSYLLEVKTETQRINHSKNSYLSWTF